MKYKKKLQLTAIAIIIAIASLFIYKGAIAPKLYDKYLNTGIKYLMDGQYEEAILAFDKAIKIEPKTTEARVYQAKAYVGNEEFDKAVEVLEEAQNIDIMNEELLKEILEILNEIDSDIAYEFLDRFIQAVGKDNISQEINDILNSANEIPSEPVADPAPGPYVGPISVKLKLDKLKVGHSYYYTLDGTIPNKGSEKYRGEIGIAESTTIKLIGYNKNDESTEVITLEYIIDKGIIDDVKGSIVEGETLIKDTTVGTEIGNISKEDKDRLQLIVSEAKDLLNKDFIRYEDVSSIKDKLENSIKEFKENIIKPVDKSKLKSYIYQAKQLYNNSREGNQKGQYKSGSKSNLMNAINKAEEVYNNSSAKQDEIDLATSNLNSAISTFKNNKIVQNDRNPDGSYTRAYVEAYVKRTYTDLEVSVLDASWDGFYNNEICYFILGHDKMLTPAGYTREAAFFIGSKTLNQYSTFDVGF
ncbi:MAG: FN3 associated domain-containing protein [Romboutsia timonensis]|uniref:chitobiase/beta-hexosaminidase C-terminal domain-containing protein n=1 Tax=Romboutsia timonensis TaxID=1776391 RepID=UPI002A76345C|nr:chitobiase/beta-hexosaminidase C-terminal domain-containing protein [Romboutsia timonensis]MDY2881467.1 FN3 associated domain-containing protein [Romboutsia timonensis]